MSSNSQKYAVGNWYYLIILFILAIASYLAMPDTDNTADAGTGLTFLAILALSMSLVPYLLLHFTAQSKSHVSTPSYITSFGFYFVWMAGVCTMTDNTRNIFGLTTIFLTIIVSQWMLRGSYFRSRRGELNRMFFAAVLFLLACIVVQYIHIYSIANMLSDEKSHIAVSYFPLFILPILLLSESKIVRYASIVITALVIISSIKRGGLIALGASLMIYVLVKQIVSGKSMMKQLLIVFAAAAVMGGVLYYLNKQEENNVIERIMNISDDGGSGRDVIWEDTYYNIQNRDFLSRMVGDGYRSAQKVSKYNLPAHNDVLEIWYDFGFIGLILYSIAIFQLIFYIIRLIRRKSQYAPHMAMTMTFFLIFSMISIVILYFWLILSMFTFGILTGMAERELEEQNNEK